MNDKTDLDATLDNLSRKTGQMVYGLVWQEGSPLFVMHDPEAALGITA